MEDSIKSKDLVRIEDSIKKYFEEHTERLMEIIERLENIEAKIGHPSPVKATTTTANGRKKCAYDGPKHGTCRRDALEGSDYCDDHPNNVLRRRPKTAGSEKTPAKMATNKLNDDYEQITAPAPLKGIIISKTKPHQAFFALIGKKANDIGEAQIEALKEYEIEMTTDSDAISQAKEELVGKGTVATETPKGNVGIAKVVAGLEPTRRRTVQVDSDDDEPEPKKEEPKKEETKPIRRSAEKVKPKEESESEDDEPPKPARRTTRNLKKDDSDED